MPGGATTALFAQRLRALFAPVKFWEVEFSSADLTRLEALFVFQEKGSGTGKSERPAVPYGKERCTAALPIRTLRPIGLTQPLIVRGQCAHVGYTVVQPSNGSATTRTWV
jgi:hypothetical protein